MKIKCLRCNIPLSNDYQLIFDETGIELQLDKLLAELFEIFVVIDNKTTQALCAECVNKLIELYDTQKYKEEKLELSANDESNHTEPAVTDGDIKDEEPSSSVDLDIIEEIAEDTENNEDSKGVNEVSSLIDNFTEFEEAGGGLIIRNYLQDVIKSDLEQITFDQDSVCRLCEEPLTSHTGLLIHVAEIHQTESEQYPCIFCDELEYFDTITSLAYHIVLKHYDLTSITIYCMCPECNTRFSSFLEYNKHSCYKKSFGGRLLQECAECLKKFSSNKRYRFHLQFHLEKQRPKACFICDFLFSDENDFFEHIMYAHEKDNAFICRQCDRVCTTEQLFDNHMKLHNAVRSFHCQYCSKSYLYNQMLMNHIQQHHSDKQSNECKICRKSLASRHLLKRHMQLMHSKETENDVFVCEVCGLVVISEEDSKCHIVEDICPGAEIKSACLKIAYACEFCELAFNSVENLKIHRAIHEDNEFKCWICDSQYSEYKKLKTHYLTHNTYESIQKLFPINRHYVCNIDSCNQSYLTWPTLRAHKVRHTTKFTCNFCKQTFSNEPKLNAHLKSHENNDDYACQFCSKMCVSQMSLAVHVARKHNNNCETCPICNATCNSEEALKEHIDTKHTEMECEHCGKITKNKRNLEIHIQMVHTQVKNFFCAICNKGYFYNSDLKTHERAAHAEPNKYKCQHCNFSSSYEASFNAHILKHEKNKPFKCEECTREFTRKSCFKLHLLRHSDNKPFVCPVEDCGRSFVMKGILNSHMKNAHPELKRSYSRPTKQKKPNPDIESASSSDNMITEVFSNGEYLEVEDGEGGIVIFDGANAEEEIVLECSGEGDMYMD